MISLADSLGLSDEILKLGVPGGVFLALVVAALVRVWTTCQTQAKADAATIKQIMEARVEDAKEATQLINTATNTLDKVVDYMRERGSLQDKYQDWVRDRIEEFRNVPIALSELKQMIDRDKRQRGKE